MDETGETTDRSDARKVEILTRHVDHLMGQLYHQIELVQQEKARANHHEAAADELRLLPNQLDQANDKILALREEITGHGEVTLELRTRLAELEKETESKEHHIHRLEQMLGLFWNSPMRRRLRSFRNLFRRGGGNPEGTDATPDV